VRFYDGSTLLSAQRVPPYRQSVAAPACDTPKTFTAIAIDSAGQTASKSATVTIACPAPTPTPTATPVPEPSVPAAPSLTWLNKPTKIAGARTFGVAATAPAGVRSVELTLGVRRLCGGTEAHLLCTVRPTGADVGAQTLRAVVTDALGRSAELTTPVLVAKLKPSALSLTVTSTPVKGGKLKRTITGTLKLPPGVTAAQGCSGSVTIKLSRSGRTFLNQQVPLTRSCRVKRSVTATRAQARFQARAAFEGNAFLTAITASRRFL
jgi:hypothetical protein